ncbi:MAG: 16S rRNA (uracil(1498)-N(3))-methyltransferase [Betaproteobacteria bacterium AqS2]|uniref:Ribosomal RNA small subunit methyltransferase E n=1 Tax=Candidatus Amphirhobacter heronislandensis TaxID=1732024 RepID=A0A930UED0_9GAMM|nr:16S rRNA (uracil(1498)-N(3))-methyltransferase [Betaproteobacteria bacterium AqS2]
MASDGEEKAAGNLAGWQRIRLPVDPAMCRPGTHPLADAQVHYLVAVLKLRPSGRFYAFDGAGREVAAELVRSGRRGHAMRVVGPSPYRGADPSLRLHVGQGLTSRSRLDYAVEKMTEVGAASIAPLRSFGVPAAAERGGDLTERWLRVAQAAAAQCGRMHVPDIGAPGDAGEWLESLPDGCPAILLSPAAGTRLSACDFKQLLGEGRDLAVLIGRKAGLSDAEEEFCRGRGCVPLSLGERVLRAETAGVVALSVVLAQVGEF